MQTKDQGNSEERWTLKLSHAPIFIFQKSTYMVESTYTVTLKLKSYISIPGPTDSPSHFWAAHRLYSCLGMCFHPAWHNPGQLPSGLLAGILSKQDYNSEALNHAACNR